MGNLALKDKADNKSLNSDIIRPALQTADSVVTPDYLQIKTIIIYRHNHSDKDHQIYLLPKSLNHPPMDHFRL